MTHVEVIEMHQHFLYLPFYYAKDNNFFGYLKGDYDITMCSALPSTDDGALTQMLKVSKDGVLRFALCDPSPLLDMTLDEDDPPAVLAALITNAAIWAIDKEADPVRTFDELKNFQTIISFGEGTTTFGMANRIVGSGTKSQMKKVEPGQELNALWGEPNAVALSPEILEVVSAVRNHEKLKIILPLGSTREYDNVLVTALSTRKSVVDSHPGLIDGILAAIQRAIVELNLQSAEVRKYAAARFNRSDDLVSLALEAAADAAVFPPNIIVRRNHWEAAAQSYCEGKACTFDAATRLKSRKLYELIAAKHVKHAKNAMQKVVLNTMHKAGWDSRIISTLKIGLGVLIGIVFASAIYFALPIYLAALLALGGLVSFVTARLKRDDLTAPQLAMHVLAYLSASVALYFGIFVTKSNFGLTLEGGFIFLVVGADYTLLFRQARQ